MHLASRTAVDFYETEAEFRKAIEARIKRRIGAPEWKRLPVGLAPFGREDFLEVIAKLKEKKSKRFLDDCARLSQLVSWRLEAIHRSEDGHREVLDWSKYAFRRLGDFWAWSWLFADDHEQEVFTKKRRDFLGVEWARESLSQWDLFWRAVGYLAAVHEQRPFDCLLYMFWPDTVPGGSRRPFWTDSGSCRAEFRSTHEALVKSRLAHLRIVLEKEALDSLRRYRALKPKTSDLTGTSHTMRLALAMGNGQSWETRRLIYSLLAPGTSLRLRPARSIPNQRQFRSEAMRLQQKMAHEAKEESLRSWFEYVIGPRWDRDGNPTKP